MSSTSTVPHSPVVSAQPGPGFRATEAAPRPARGPQALSVEPAPRTDPGARRRPWHDTKEVSAPGQGDVRVGRRDGGFAAGGAVA